MTSLRKYIFLYVYISEQSYCKKKLYTDKYNCLLQFRRKNLACQLCQKKNFRKKAFRLQKFYGKLFLTFLFVEYYFVD